MRLTELLNSRQPASKKLFPMINENHKIHPQRIIRKGGFRIPNPPFKLYG
jgi:hypothetical protein